MALPNNAPVTPTPVRIEEEPGTESSASVGDSYQIEGFVITTVTAAEFVHISLEDMHSAGSLDRETYVVGYAEGPTDRIKNANKTILRFNSKFRVE